MKKLQLIALLIIFVLPIFLNGFTYLSEEQYGKLSSTERAEYLKELDAEYNGLLERSANAKANNERLLYEIEQLRKRLGEVDEEIAAVLERLGYTEDDITDIHTRIQYYKDQLDNWERMSDDELWKNAKAFKELEEDYLGTRNSRLARLPEFQADFNDLDRRFTALNEALENARKSSAYYEDTYTVRQGDTYAKISGYDFIYGDSSKWGIIFRANRDQVRDPNSLRPDMTIKIPRGLPPTWKVFRGESLWRISAYPEVYGTGFKWPTLFRANQDKIKNPDLIYPNQVFVIPRDDN